MSVRVSITSDFICPWCFVGEQRLASAVARLPQGIGVAIVWRPFELNPGMPPQGMERRAYRVAKFGSWERGQALDARVAEVAARDGLRFNHDRISRTPNTFQAHRLMWFAADAGFDAGRLARRLLHSYFTDGRDLSDPAVLVDIAAAEGMPEPRVTAFLAGREAADAVRALLDEGRRDGIDGVPFFRIGEVELSGAQPVEVFERALRHAASVAVG
jgi:predicted DsbA family dithiol-disulfide isomerase